ncbi:MAG: hypothetical protein Q9166_002302 [cf. Caloplaca sp. 2 TL-2023]
MLVRILADNPGKSFTRNLDSKFVATVKELLRDGRDMSVQQILRETLDSFETNKVDDETLGPLRDMWKKEKPKWQKRGTPVFTFPNNPHNIPSASYQAVNNDQNYFARNHRPRGLPPPHELAQRIEEARTSSKLLLQVVQSTPPHEILTNELVKEFIERCQSASRSIQSYINSDDPPPDENTLLTLIETNDGISTALSRYQRAMLQARRLIGASPGSGQGGLQRNGTLHQEMPVNGPPPLSNGPYSPPSAPPETNGSFSAPSGPPPQQQQNYREQQTYPPPAQPFYPQPQPRADPDGNPFDDPKHETAPSQAPADFGLPPTIPPTQDPNTYQGSGSGYHPRYSSPPPTTATNHVVRKEVGSGGGTTQRGGRSDTHVDDSSDDDDDEMLGRGQGHMRGGQPVTYRF